MSSADAVRGSFNTTPHLTRRSAFLSLLVFVLGLGTPCLAAQESLRLRITNSLGGAVEASTDRGRTWQRLGSVTTPADQVNRAGFTAALWAQDSAIAATAVNAIHIKVANDSRSGRPITLSIVPGGTVVGAATRQRSSVIFTDIAGGTSIFGGGLGPYVNSPVLAESTLSPLPSDYQPHDGDVLVIIREEPLRLPFTITFENWRGGGVSADYGAEPVGIGVVDKPVTGIGRFEGGIHSWPGRIRANHPGVIDVSTAPHGMVGGFQIIPRKHAESPEMAYAKTGSAWMIVGPSAPDASGWAGEPPLFSRTILPSYRPDDMIGEYADWVQRLWSRTMVQVRYRDGPWELVPRIAFSNKVMVSNVEQSCRGRERLWLIPSASLSGPLTSEAARLADHALQGVSHIRIVFPLTTFPPSLAGERS